MARTRIEEIDILRGIAAVLMILGFSFIEYPVDISTVSWCHALGHFIYTFHMELFFLLAGAVYHCSSYSLFMEKKFKRILVPYLFFGTITILLKSYGGSAINGNESVGYGFIKFLFHGGNYWFLYVLFILFALFPWLEKIFKTTWSEIALCCGILLVRQFCCLPNLFAFDTLLYYLPFFIFGKLFIQSIDNKVSRLNAKSKIIFFIVFSAIFIALDFIEISGVVVELGTFLSFIRAIAIILPLYVFVKLYLVSTQRRGFIYNLLIDSSKYSLQFYLFNGFLLTFLRIMICNVFNITSPLIIVVGIWTLDILFTLIACKIIIPKIPLLRELCGL